MREWGTVAVKYLTPWRAGLKPELFINCYAGAELRPPSLTSV